MKSFYRPDGIGSTSHGHEDYNETYGKVRGIFNALVDKGYNPREVQLIISDCASEATKTYCVFESMAKRTAAKEASDMRPFYPPAGAKDHTI